VSRVLLEAVLLVVAPNQHDLAFSTSEVLAAAAKAFEPRTNLSFRSSEQVGVDPTVIAECPVAERLSCWVRAVARDRPLEVLLVVGMHPLNRGEVRLYSMMVDLHAAQRILGDVPRDEETWREETERRIFQQTVRTEPEIVRGPLELDAYFDRLVDRFRPELEARGHWGRRDALAPPQPAPIVVGTEPPNRLAYDATLWGGVALAAIGTGVAIVSATVSSRTRERCFTRDDSNCALDPFSAIALGIGLGTFGLTSSLGTLFFEEPGDLPWLEWTIGALLGGVAYTASWLALR
jgi:hypothetical protein